MKERLIGLNKKIAFGGKPFKLLAGSSFGNHAWEFIASDEEEKLYEITVSFETQAQKERFINQIKDKTNEYVSCSEYEELKIVKLTPHMLWLWLVVNTELTNVA